MDVSIQLLIIMTGKQVINNILELGVPKLKSWWRNRKDKKASHIDEGAKTRWERDMNLEAEDGFYLFSQCTICTSAVKEQGQCR